MDKAKRGLLECFTNIQEGTKFEMEALDAFKHIKEIPEAQERIAIILNDYKFLKENFSAWVTIMDDSVKAKYMVNILDCFSD